MKSQGIRIRDKHKESGIGCIDLIDILEEIKDGNLINWALLFLYASWKVGEGKSMRKIEPLIKESHNGLEISWVDLNIMAKKFEQIFEMTIIGCMDKNLIRRYEGEQEMYESCDTVLDMTDGCFWEIFSKDKSLIMRLAAKFKETELLQTDYLKEYKESLKQE